MVYQWIGSYGIKTIDPQIAGKALADLEERHNGVIVPRLLVEESRLESAPLHDCFEWDPEKAHDAYLLIQARTIIRSIQAVSPIAEGEIIPRKIYVKVDDPVKGEGYQSLLNVVKDSELRQQELSYCAEMMAKARKRLSVFEDMVELVGAIENTETKIIEYAMKDRKTQSKSGTTRQASVSV